MKQDDPEEQTNRTAQSESDDEYCPRPWELDTESDSEVPSDFYSEEGEVDEDDRASMFEHLAATASASERAANACLGLSDLI